MTTEFKIFHVDGCMYVAATDDAQASAHVKAECGGDCGDPDWVKEVGHDMPVTRANIEEGEEVTPELMTTVGELAREEIAAGKVLPFTVFSIRTDMDKATSAPASVDSVMALLGFIRTAAVGAYVHANMFGDKDALSHYESQLRAEVERLAAQAAPRSLSEAIDELQSAVHRGELPQQCEDAADWLARWAQVKRAPVMQATWPQEEQAIQRKSCEVNGLTIPASGGRV